MHATLPKQAGVFVVCALAFTLAVAQSAKPPAKGFFTKHCLECHDADVQKGGLRLDTLAFPQPTDFR